MCSASPGALLGEPDLTCPGAGAEGVVCLGSALPGVWGLVLMAGRRSPVPWDSP